MPATLNLDKIIGGDPFVLALTIKENGVTQDVTTWTFSAKWRPYRKSLDVIPFVVDTATSGAVGVVLLSLDAATTPGLFDGVWAAKYNKPGGTPTTFVEGKALYESGIA